MSKTKKNFNYKDIVQNSQPDFVKLPDGTLQTLEYKGNMIIKLHMDGIGKVDGQTLTAKNWLRLINELEERGGLTALKEAIMPLAKAVEAAKKTKTSTKTVNSSKDVEELKADNEALNEKFDKLQDLILKVVGNK